MPFKSKKYHHAWIVHTEEKKLLDACAAEIGMHRGTMIRQAVHYFLERMGVRKRKWVQHDYGGATVHRSPAPKGRCAVANCILNRQWELDRVRRGKRK